MTIIIFCLCVYKKAAPPSPIEMEGALQMLQATSALRLLMLSTCVERRERLHTTHGLARIDVISPVSFGLYESEV